MAGTFKNVLVRKMKIMIDTAPHQQLIIFANYQLFLFLEIIIEMCSLGGDNDFFDSDCNATTFLDFQYNLCNSIYKSIGWKQEFLRVDAVKQLYGWDFTQASNIVFT